MSTFYCLHDEHLKPKYTVSIPLDVTKTLSLKTEQLADNLWNLSFDFDNPNGPWTENTLPQLLLTCTHLSAMISSYANWAEHYDNRWNEETYVAMHALATDILNLSRFTAQRWQLNNLNLDEASDADHERNQIIMRGFADFQSRQIGFSPVDEQHLAAAIGNPNKFLDTLRTSYFYLLETNLFSDEEFSFFQNDLSYATAFSANLIHPLFKFRKDNDVEHYMKYRDYIDLYLEAYDAMPKEYEPELMVKHLIQFR